jgi:hypothetical protein
MTDENRNINKRQTNVKINRLPTPQPIRTHAPASNRDDTPRRQEKVDGISQNKDKAVGFGVSRVRREGRDI